MTCKGHHHQGAAHKSDSADPVINSERMIATKLTMQPKDTNGAGKIFGGKLLELMDLAGAYTAHRVCKNRFIQDMVTRVTNGTEFRQPVEVNDTVTFYGKVIKVGNTSVTVQVEAEADRAGTIIPVLSSTMVFVALDKEGKPTPIMDSHCESAAAHADITPVAAPTTADAPASGAAEPVTDAPAEPKKCKCKNCSCKKCKCKGKGKKCKCKKRKCKGKSKTKAEHKCGHKHSS
jgi:acyl-CoA thioesterase YciA